MRAPRGESPYGRRVWSQRALLGGGLLVGALACTSPRPQPSAAPRRTAAAEIDPAAEELRKSAETRCEFAGGIRFHGRRRYLHGVNYAWREFATDFGGMAAWKRGGVRAERAAIDRDFAAMAASGISVVRWWIFPELHGDGLQLEGDEPRVTEAALLDLDAALALAQEHDIYLLFTLFSFDAFRPASEHVARVDLAPIARDRARREALTQRIVLPLVDRAARGRHPHRVFGWDLMNEPEWAVADSGLPNMCTAAGEKRIHCVSLREMRELLRHLAQAIAARVHPLPEHQRPLVTLGSVGPDAAQLWAEVPQDFVQHHFYDADYRRGGLRRSGAAPTVLGEFPSWGLAATADGRPRLDGAQILDAAAQAGFQGSLAWMYNAQEPRDDWPALSRALRTFADAKGCQARF